MTNAGVTNRADPSSGISIASGASVKRQADPAPSLDKISGGSNGRVDISISYDGDRAEITKNAKGLSHGLIDAFRESAAPEPIRFMSDILREAMLKPPSPYVNITEFKSDPSDKLDFRNIAPPVNRPDTPDTNNQEVQAASALTPPGECKTCESRRYVDRSNDSSVSYQTPTKLDPNTAGVKVAAHEQEHVNSEQSKARTGGREIVHQSVTLTYDCCPECGRNYVSGGTTRTSSVSKGNSGEDVNESCNTSPLRGENEDTGQ